MQVVFDLAAHREKLAALAQPDGGWGYSPGQPAHLEPTCLSLLALAPDRPRFADAIGKGEAFVRQCAQLMLAGSNENDRQQRERDVPPEGKRCGLTPVIERDRATDDDGEIQIGAEEVIEISVIIGLTKRLQK